MKIKKDHIELLDGKIVPLSDIEKAEVRVPVERAKGMRVAQDALTNLLSVSLAHGNEKVNVVLALDMKTGGTVEEKMNHELLTKGTLDYHACVRRAREAEQKINQLRKQ